MQSLLSGISPHACECLLFPFLFSPPSKSGLPAFLLRFIYDHSFSFLSCAPYVPTRVPSSPPALSFFSFIRNPPRPDICFFSILATFFKCPGRDLPVLFSPERRQCCPPHLSLILVVVLFNTYFSICSFFRLPPFFGIPDRTL